MTMKGKAVLRHGQRNQRVQRVGSNLLFSSEGLLRDAIAGLLTKVPWGITGVQILHGSEEDGKDIVFTLPGAFGEPILCACVVKNKKITGSTESSSGALSILNQAKQAFKIPYIGEGGERLPVQRVYVVTPYTLQPPTRRSLQGQLDGDIQFIGGSVLFDLFQAYWPNYLADEFALVKSHLGKTQAALQRDQPLDEVTRVYHTASVDREVTQTYVQPRFFRLIRSYRMNERLRHVLALEDLPLKRRKNPLRKDNANVPQWIPVVPDVRLITITETSIRSKTIEQLRLALSKLESARLFPSPVGSRVTESMSALLAELDAVRLQHIQRRYDEARRLGLPTDDSSNAPGEITSDQFDYFENKARQAQAELNDVLNTLQRTLDDVHDLAASTADGVDALMHPAFQLAAAIDEIAPELPNGILALDVERRLQFPDNLLDRIRQSLLITGAPGFGKTSFCRYQALHDVKRYNANKADYIPVYVPLHQVAENRLRSFDEAFLEHVGISGLIPKDDMSRAHFDKTRVYMDGLDEVPSPNARSKIVRLTKHALDENPNLQVILTARDYVVSAALDWMPHVHLDDFDDKQIRTLVQRWIDDEEEVNQFYLQLSRSPGLAVLLRTPLLATLTILVFKQTKNLPADRTRLYEIFVDLLASGWDLAKRVHRGSEFTFRLKVSVLRRVAMLVHLDRKREFSAAVFRRVVSEMPVQKKLDAKVLVEEMINDGLITSNGEYLQFPHLSFQEFLAARDLLGDPNAKRLNFILNSYLQGEGWWKEVLTFYIGLSGKSRELTQWVRSGVKRVRSASQKAKDAQAAVLFETIATGSSGLESQFENTTTAQQGAI